MAGQTHSCVVGKDPTSLLSIREDLPPLTLNNRTLILDLNSSSQCSGRINTWRLCYYFETIDEGSDDDFIGMWRPQNNGSLYELLDGSMLTLRDATDRFELVDFICVRHVISDPFEVLKGDVIGVVISSNSTASSLVGPRTGGTLRMAVLLPDQDYNEIELNDTIESPGSYELYIEANFAGIQVS